MLLASLGNEVEDADLVLAGIGKREAKSDDSEEDLDDWGDEDFMDNLTYHEDSLSVMKGLISTPAGKDIPMWVTTDSGSMTQLIQSDKDTHQKDPWKKML